MASSDIVSGFELTNHALEEIARRQIDHAVVTAVLADPGQFEEIKPGRIVYQSQIAMGQPSRFYLVQVFVDTDRKPPQVVTVCRTSKIEKYWRIAP